MKPILNRRKSLAECTEMNDRIIELCSDAMSMREQSKIVLPELKHELLREAKLKTMMAINIEKVLLNKMHELSIVTTVDAWVSENVNS